MVGPEFQRTEPENQPASDASIDLVALTQLNSSLERKLRYSVTVANHCALALEKERAESGDKLKKISFALLLQLHIRNDKQSDRGKALPHTCGGSGTLGR